MINRTVLVGAVALIAACASTPAQQSTPDWQTKAGGKMSFEVASVRPIEPDKPMTLAPSFKLDANDVYDRQPNGIFREKSTLELYIEFAYKLWLTTDERAVMLANQPEWVSKEPFVIEARAAGNPTKDQMRLMVQSLLADRFHLQLHFEKHEFPVLALTLIHPGKSGPGLRPHSQGPPCDTPWTPPANGVPPDITIFPPTCTFQAYVPPGTHTALVAGRDVTVKLMAAWFSGLQGVERTVVDQTGLSGNFDFRAQFAFPPDTSSAPNTDAPANPTGTTFLEALKEQLGMQLKPTRAILEIPVIDRVEQPSEN